MLEADQVFLYLIWKSTSYTLQTYADVWLSPYWLWITKLQSHFSPAIMIMIMIKITENTVTNWYVQVRKNITNHIDKSQL